MRRSLLALLLLFATLATSSGVALADKRKPDDDAKARKAEAQRFFEEGTKYYSLREFERAVDNYKKAFELEPTPVFLYNIAQAYRLARSYDDALYFYKSYLRNLPEADNRGEVERRIAEMQAAIDQQTATQTPPNEVVSPDGRKPPPPEPQRKPIPRVEQVSVPAEPRAVDSTPAPSRGRPVYKKWWFWAGVGAVAVGTTIAVVAATGGGSEGPSGDPGWSRKDVF